MTSTTTRKAKTPKAPGFMREILAMNVSKMLAHHYRALPNVTARQRALAKDSGISFSTVQRIMAKETGATIENIENIAGAFHLSAYQLLVPALDAENPQIIKGATAAEQNFYRLYKLGRLTPETV